MTLSELPLHTSAVVESVQDLHANDAIARRLRELGFVNGEYAWWPRARWGRAAAGAGRVHPVRAADQ